MKTKWSPRPLDPVRDRGAVRDLWELALGARWPIHGDTLAASMPLAYGLGDNEKLSGAIGFDETGAISFVMVDPARRREGIGTALHQAAVTHLAGAKPEWTLGGAHSFWRGIPDNLPDAEPFFMSAATDHSRFNLRHQRALISPVIAVILISLNCA
jgi:GNAT superfamily N-acetyltransferase